MLTEGGKLRMMQKFEFSPSSFLPYTSGEWNTDYFISSSDVYYIQLDISDLFQIGCAVLPDLCSAKQPTSIG